MRWCPSGETRHYLLYVFGRRKAVEASARIAQHQHDFFAGHELTERQPLNPERAAVRLPRLTVHEVAPGPRLGAWTYLTVGVWEAAHEANGHGFEFLMTAPKRDDRIIEVLTWTAFFHSGPLEQRLDLGHTAYIGEPWLAGSACDHYLVSLPYLFGPDLEECAWDGGHARHLWLLPITRAERDFKAAHGVEALEERLEAAAIIPTDPFRPSVVEG